MGFKKYSSICKQKYGTYYILKCDKTLDKRCKAFLKEHEYRSSEEVWLKMIYIISNS